MALSMWRSCEQIRLRRREVQCVLNRDDEIVPTSLKRSDHDSPSLGASSKPRIHRFKRVLVRRLRNEERLARHEQYGCYRDQAAADAVKMSSASSSRFPVNIDRPIATRETNSSTSAPSSSLTVSITVSQPDCRFSKRLQKSVRVAARAPACEWTLLKANPSTTPGSHNRPIADRMRALRWKYAVEDRPRAARDRPGTEAAIGAMRSSRGMI